jgi:hypothetical protein
MLYFNNFNENDKEHVNNDVWLVGDQDQVLDHQRDGVM